MLGHDVVKLLKTQDAGYVTTMLLKTKRARERLEQEFVVSEDQGAEMLGALASQEKGSHTVFVDSREEQRQHRSSGEVAFQPDPATRKPGTPSMYEDKDNSDGKPFLYLPKQALKSRRLAERQELASKQDKLLRKQHRKEQDARKSKLAALYAREKDLIKAERELDLQRAKMSNSVGGITKVGAKWKVRERRK